MKVNPETGNVWVTARCWRPNPAPRIVLIAAEFAEGESSCFGLLHAEGANSRLINGTVPIYLLSEER
jgi:hypothetical protein